MMYWLLHREMEASGHDNGIDERIDIGEDPQRVSMVVVGDQRNACVSIDYEAHIQWMRVIYLNPFNIK